VAIKEEKLNDRYRKNPDQSNFKYDGRYILKNMVKRFEDIGYY